MRKRQQSFNAVPSNLKVRPDPLQMEMVLHSRVKTGGPRRWRGAANEDGLL